MFLYTSARRTLLNLCKVCLQRSDEFQRAAPLSDVQLSKVSDCKSSGEYLEPDLNSECPMQTFSSVPYPFRYA